MQLVDPGCEPGASLAGRKPGRNDRSEKEAEKEKDLSPGTTGSETWHECYERIGERPVDIHMKNCLDHDLDEKTRSIDRGYLKIM